MAVGPSLTAFTVTSMVSTVCAVSPPLVSVEVEVEVDYLGFDIPDEWVVGYGLDYAEEHRTLPYIGIVKPTDG